MVKQKKEGKKAENLYPGSWFGQLIAFLLISKGNFYDNLRHQKKGE